MSDIPNFDRAEYHTPQPLQPAPTWENAQPAISRFPAALALGFVAMLLGSAAYSGFTIITHIAIGFLALFLGIFIARAMLYASGGIGGRRYQVAASIFTYFSVSLAAIPEILWDLHRRGTDVAHLSRHGWLVLAQYGVASPFLELTSSFASGAIGLFIIFIGIRGAWRTAAGRAPAL